MRHTEILDMERVRHFLANAERTLAADEAEWREPLKGEPLQVQGRFQGKVTSAWEASVHHLLLGDAAASRGHAEALPGRVTHYFFGDWRYFEDEWDRDLQKFVPWGTEERSRARLGWIDPYRYGLAASLAVGDLAAAGRIASYTHGSRLRDIGYTCGPENTPEAVDAYEAYADLLLGKPLRLPPAWRGPGRKRTKRVEILGRVFASLEGGDGAAAGAALDDFAAHYKRHECEFEVDLISPDVTILDHLVRRAGGPATTRDGQPRPFVLRWD